MHVSIFVSRYSLPTKCLCPIFYFELIIYYAILYMSVYVLQLR